MRKWIRELTERALSVKIYRELPPGLNLYEDLKHLASWSPNGVIFDVGANIGQTVLELSTSFPNALIYAFEPSPATFDRLVERTKHLKNIRHFNYAFGPQRGSAKLFLHRKSSQHTLRDDLRDAPGFHNQGYATVDVRAVDEFLTEQRIDLVQYLKIDTEGYDLEVVKGAQNALASARIGVIEVEAGFLQDEGKFIPLERFRSYLRERSFLLFGIYDEQVRVRHNTRLRRCNAVFVSERFAE